MSEVFRVKNPVDGSVSYHLGASTEVEGVKFFLSKATLTEPLPPRILQWEEELKRIDSMNHE